MKDRIQARQILEDLVNGKDLFSIPDYIDSVAVRPTMEAYGYTCNKKHGPVQIMIVLSKINFYEMLFIASMVDEDRAKIFSECGFVPLNSFLDLLISNDVLKKWDISLHYDYDFKGWWNKKEVNKLYKETLEKIKRFNQDAVDAAQYAYERFKMEEKVLEDYAEIRFMTRNEAEKILDQLINDAGKKGEVTIEDFVTYTGFKGFINWGYKDLIWTLADTIKGKVYQEQSGKFFIDLPEPHRKDSDEENDECLFFDSITRHTFKGSIKELRKVLKELNDIFMDCGEVTLTQYLEAIGVKSEQEYDEQLMWADEFPNFHFSYEETSISHPNYITIGADNRPQHVEKKKDPVLSIWYDYLMCSDSHLYVCYNNGTEKDYHHHNYAVKGKTWTDQVFEIAKYLYTFIDEVLDDVYGEGQFTPDMISRNAIWMALDVVDHERQEIQYNMNDPEEFDRITDL